MKEHIPKIIVIIGILLVVIFLGNMLMNGYNHVENTIPNATCDELLTMIQREGMKPNYQYDVREWIAQECWK